MHEAVNAISLEDAFEVQDKLAEKVATSMGGIGGYKIAWNTDALMEAFGMPHPGMGYVFNRYIRPDGAEIALADFEDLLLEVEICAYLGADLAPGNRHTAASVREAVDRFTVGFEVLNRYKGAGDAKPFSILAHNVFNAGAVVGGLFDSRPMNSSQRRSQPA